MSKRSTFFVYVILSLFISSYAFSDNRSNRPKLEDVSIQKSQKGIYVDLKFDQKISFKKIAPEYERNFVQFSLSRTVMDRAKIVPVHTSKIDKVFAYPYTPSTVRVRLMLNEDNQWAKGRISAWNKNRDEIRVFIKSEKVALHSGMSAVDKKTDSASKHEEQELIKEVLNNTKDVDIKNPTSVKAALGSLEDRALNDDKENEKENGTVGINANPSKYFVRVVLVLVGILSIFGVVVFLLQRYSSKLKKLPFGKKDRLIKVIATHYLGHKRSIALVKVANEYMVVGVGSDGISLISKLGSDLNIDKYLEDRFWGGTFEKHLDKYSKEKDPVENLKGVDASRSVNIKNYDGFKDLNPLKNPESSESIDTAKLESSIRDKIRSKVSSLKQLS